MTASTGLRGTEVYRASVVSDWIDVNRHMNVAYYLLAFDLAVDALWIRFGITEESIAKTHGSTFAVESHVTYQSELGLGDEFVITTEVLAYDRKRLHQFQRMFRAEDSRLAATCEWMNLHVDLERRKVAPWPEAVLDRIAVFSAALPRGEPPAEAGRRMRIREPLYTGVDPYGEQ